MKLISTIILAILLLASPTSADLICDGCSLTECTVDGTVAMQGTSPTLAHVSMIGNITVNSDTASITNTAIVGDVTETTNYTTDQVAVFGTASGDGAPSEALIELAVSPFLSATDLRLHRINGSSLFDVGTETFTDIRGRTGDDLGAYNHLNGMLDLGKGDALKSYSP